MGPELPDLIAGLASLISLIVFLRFWKPPYREEFACTFSTGTSKTDEEAAEDIEEKRENEADDSDAAKQHSDEKVEVSHSNRSDDGTEEPPNPEAITPLSEIVKPTLWESILAWSPWVLIVVVVIM